MLKCSPDGVPLAVQEIGIDVNDFGEDVYVAWLDCRGRRYVRTLAWLLERTVKPRTFDQVLVCRNYARYVLERDVGRWWGERP